MPELPNPSLVPFVVSVTGHRDLRSQDLDSLRHEVRSVFSGFRKRMPSTPMILLSGLAEGADQLVAEVALEQKVFLAAVLPMPLDLYRVQMPDQAQKQLDDLLARSTLKIQLSLEGRMAEEIRTSEEARATCYDTLARFLARQGQALIALWDGVESQKPGGTSIVVSYVRSGRLDPGNDEAETRCGAVYHIVTPRRSGIEPAPVIRTLPLDGKAAAARGFVANLLEENLERFNRASSKLPRREVSVHANLIEETNLPLTPFLERLQTLYRQADAISLLANRKRRIYLAMILLTAVVGTLFYGIHGEMFPEQIWLWFGFPFFVIAAVLLYRAARANHVEEKYLDARALAEALRVQFFWELAGIRQSVDQYYLMNHRTELDWIRFALKNVWLLSQGTDEFSTAASHYPVVLEKWVRDQANWYRLKAGQQSQIVRRRQRVSRYGLLVAVAWSILVPTTLLILRSLHLLPSWNNGSKLTERIYQGCHVALALPALLAGAYRLWIEQAGYEEQSREYSYMERQFSHIAKELEAHLDSPEEADKLLLALGIEALSENGRWLLLHRERPLEVLSTP